MDDLKTTETVREENAVLRRRVDDLLAANNRLMEDARAARRELVSLKEAVRRLVR